LLTSDGRPGFYFRVLQEGAVGAGDEIVKVGEATERMSVTEINALLYSPQHLRDRLEQALRIDALSPGWRRSFEALLRNPATGTASGNAGLAPPAAAHPVAPGFRPLTVTAIEQASADVLSLTLQDTSGQPLQMALPGQYVVLRLPRAASGTQLFRSYSLSGAASTARYRISVKIEPNGAAGTYLKKHARLGDALDVSAPRGSFVLQPGDGPVVMLSAGIGVTPVLAMLHALAAAGSTRQVWWLHGARDRQHHAFADEARGLVHALLHGRSYICYSQPDSGERLGEDFDATGHLSGNALDQLGVPQPPDFYLCGPTRFLADMKMALATRNVAPQQIHAETFNGGESKTPGIASAAAHAPHLPKADADTGPLVSFARSGVAAHWNAVVYPSILELAEACDVPVRWACRAGVCHNCESGLVSGAVSYGPEPLDMPAQGNVLVCCAQPAGDVVIDL
jgi:ferredoxin-NADP reductase